MVASVASCLQKIGFASFSVVTELLPAQGHVFRKSMLTDTVFRKLPLCLNLFCSQHVSRAELSSLPPLTGLVYRSFLLGNLAGEEAQGKTTTLKQRFQRHSSNSCLSYLTPHLTQSRCTASSHSATGRKSPLNPDYTTSGCRLCGLEPQKRFMRDVCLRNPCLL